VETVTGPYDPSCKRYAREIREYDTFAAVYFRVSLSEVTPELREKYVLVEEGTYNPENGHFLCDVCYIEAGQPTSRTGWRCP
jgi:hypothetical protein